MDLKIIIIEDEKHSKETLINLLDEFCTQVNVIGTASSVKEAVTLINSTDPDVVFLDIELHSGTGFDVLDQIDIIDFNIVFTTAYEQYAVKAIKMSSLDYLLKPINYQELQDAIERAKKIKNDSVYNQQVSTLIENLNGEEKKIKICLATSEGFEFFDIEDILYCKANGAYTQFVMGTKKGLLVSKNLKEYENMLSSSGFMRIHNSYLINLTKVKKYVKADGGYIIMQNDDHITISSKKKELFVEAMKLL